MHHWQWTTPTISVALFLRLCCSRAVLTLSDILLLIIIIVQYPIIQQNPPFYLICCDATSSTLSLKWEKKAKSRAWDIWHFLLLYLTWLDCCYATALHITSTSCISSSSSSSPFSSRASLFYNIRIGTHTCINAYVANFYIIYVGISFWRRCDNDDDEDDGRCELPPGKKYAMVSLVSFNVQCVSLDHLFSLDSSPRVLLYIFTVSGDRCENKKLHSSWM